MKGWTDGRMDREMDLFEAKKVNCGVDKSFFLLDLFLSEIKEHRFILNSALSSFTKLFSESFTSSKLKFQTEDTHLHICAFRCFSTMFCSASLILSHRLSKT